MAVEDTSAATARIAEDFFIMTSLSVSVVCKLLYLFVLTTKFGKEALFDFEGYLFVKQGSPRLSVCRISCRLAGVAPPSFGVALQGH
jgi:hypothetical protein